MGKRILFITLFFTFIIVVACRPDTTAEPTPFPATPLPLADEISGPITLTVPELALAPGVYQDQQITLSGQLQRQPLLICDNEPYPSPGTWSLIDEGASILAGGFDQQVRSLLPDGLAMTVEGQLRRWQGPVGCGKQAQSQDLWVLDVSRILSPSPLTMVTLTPSGADTTELVDVAPIGEVVEEATQDVGPEGDGTAGDEVIVTTPAESYPAPETTAGPQATQPGDSTTVPAEDGVTATVEGEAEVTPTNADLSTPQGDTTPSPVATETPLITGTPAAATATPGSGDETPTPAFATPTAAPDNLVNLGDLFDTDEEFANDILRAGHTHNWTLELFEGDNIVISAFAPSPADLTLSILKDGQTLIDRQNNAAAGETEILNKPALQGAGLYDLRVENITGEDTEYIIAIYLEDDFQIIFNGSLEPGETRSNVQLPEEATHYWNFMGEAGDTVTITAVPDATGDVYIDLFGPGATYLETGDDGFEGEEEVFIYTLANSGLHTIVISEIDFLAMNYSLSFQK